MTKAWTLILAAMSAAALVFAVGCKLTRAGYAAPEHTVALKEGKFQVRAYESLPVASTRMDAADEQDPGFMRLFP